MSRYLFYMFLVILQVLRLPLSFLVIVLKNFIPKLKERLDFERRNLIEDECLSFRSSRERADYCFEVSSEGELEQVLPLIEHYLVENKKIELIFASASVEKKCIQLAHNFKQQIRILRLPIASFFPINTLYFQSIWQWVSAETIFLCRYDFYPELMLFGFKKNLILLSAASKNMGWFKSMAYRCFRYIVAANSAEFDFFKKNYPHINSDSFDFRIPQIYKRISLKNEKLNKISTLLPYLKYLENYPSKSKLILGSAWVSDLVIFEDSSEWKKKIQDENFHLLIVPHSLSDSNINKMKEKLDNIFGDKNVAIFSEATLGKNQEIEHIVPPVVILNWRGILCELYTYFDFSYVGGGLERSIHSVLEPFLAGSKVIVTGEVSRSAEFDFLKTCAPHEICLLKNGQSFYNLFNDFLVPPPDKDVRVQINIEASQKMEKVLSEISNVK